jgi:hypothetical protein
VTARSDDAELGPLTMPVCVCGCPADEHDPSPDEPCSFCPCDRFTDRSQTPARDEQTGPSRAALTACLLLVLTGLVLLAWHDGRCHAQASTAAGHEMCREIAR